MKRHIGSTLESLFDELGEELPKMKNNSFFNTGIPFTSEDEVTILFVSALWFWHLGDKLGANAALDAAIHIHGLNKAFVSDFRS